MNIIHRRGWEIPESQAAPEHLFMNRRALLSGAATLAAAAALPARARAETADPTADLYPAKRNEKYKLDRELTPEKIAGNYNNFYEYGQVKEIAGSAQQLSTRPWTVKIDGMVEKEMTVGIDDLIARCRSKSGSTGCAASKPGRWRCRGRGSRWRSSSNYAKPLSSAKYVKMEIVPRQLDGARAEAAVFSVSLCRRADDGGGDQRADVHGDRHLRQARRETARGADPADYAVEIRLQGHQIDRAIHLHR